MAKLDFRLLRADEIDCRVAQCTDKGVSLLLYKDARCDMNILDETVGSFNWQRTHSRENANCTVSIFCDERNEWVSKEDTGTESNTEAEKGLASDSFKRACFNWGIGRELYTAPFVWVKSADCNITQGRNGKPACYDHFSVASIEYDEQRRISSLAIRNDRTGKICFEQYSSKKKPEPKPKAPAPAPQATFATMSEYHAMRERVNNIVYALTQGKPEDVASAYHFWTEGRYHKLPEIPDEDIPDVLAKAESIYRKRTGKDYE